MLTACHKRVKETRIIYRAEHILGSLFKFFFLGINCNEIFFKATTTRNVDTGIANDSNQTKVEGLQTCNFLTKRLQHGYFPVNTAKFLRNTFLQNTYGGCFWEMLIKIFLVQVDY